uniref:Xrn1 N-terminal domain-containing protein n=1 Tax=Leersia perrieri TaxID=77586 RepID=A0A0D9XP88_9ORYZ
MGVPSFYRWLVEKYPAIVSPAHEHSSNGGVIYHNLYLDMNGIIHPCFHPEDQICPPTTLEEVFHSMFEYMDRLFRIVRPTNLLYLAVGQWRRSSRQDEPAAIQALQISPRPPKTPSVQEMDENLLRDRFRAEGKEVFPRDASSSEVSDPNVITPGTEFMEKLSDALKYYIRSRLSTDPLWKDIKVILSDANVPGEGEHKIMSFIRAQRGREGYDPNTRHCLYGLDADLIMLALASHEIHFSILREVCVCVGILETSK